MLTMQELNKDTENYGLLKNMESRLKPIENWKAHWCVMYADNLKLRSIRMVTSSDLQLTTIMKQER